MRTLLGLFLVAHGLINASYFTPMAADAKGWPFAPTRSWLLAGMDATTHRPIGLTLAELAAVAFAAAGLELVDVPLLDSAWQALAVVAAAASPLLVLFWNAMLVLGIVISVAVQYATFFARWPATAFGASRGVSPAR